MEDSTEEPTPSSSSSTETPTAGPKEETTESISIDDGDFDSLVAAKVSELGIRGAAIVLFEAGSMEVPLTRGYGKVSASESSASVTPDTVFLLASVSKPFAALSVALLVDKGIIGSLDDDICETLSVQTLDECRNPHFEGYPVTWRSILTHRSSMERGLPEAEDENGNPISPTYGPSGGYRIDYPAAGNPTCPLRGVADFYKDILGDGTSELTNTVGAGINGGKPLNWAQIAEDSMGGMWSRSYPPGAVNEYSNAAYGYIPALVEAAQDGVSFADFCRQNLFAPLGMDRTAWFREDLPEGITEAVPVELKERGNGWVDVGHYCFIDYASGSLRTSANDLAKFGNAMLDNLGAPKLWSAEMGRQIVTCQERDEENGPISAKECEFGYGWAILDNAKKEITEEDWLRSAGFQSFDWTDGIWHDGAEAGSQTNMVILPRAGVYLGVLTNTDYNSDTAAQELTQFVMDVHLGIASSGDRIGKGGSGGLILISGQPQPSLLLTVMVACLSLWLW